MSRKLESRSVVTSRPSLQLVAILAAKRWVLTLCTLAGLTLGTVLAFLIPATYTAVVSIVPPQPPKSSVSNFMGSMASVVSALRGGVASSGSPDLYVRLLQSRTLADEAIRSLHLEQRWHTKTLVASEQEVSNHVHFESSKDGLIRISASDHDPRLASDLANYFVTALEHLTQSVALTEAAQRRQFYEQQMQQEREALDRTEEELSRTKQQTGLLLPEQQIRLAVQAIANTREQISSTEVRLQSLRSYEAGSHPDIVELKGVLAAQKAHLATLERTQAATPLGRTETPTSQLPGASLVYKQRQREANYRETLLGLIEKQYEAARIDELKSAPLIEVVDHALPPDSPSGPPWWLLAIGFGAIGFCLGCGSIFFSLAQQRKRQIPSLPKPVELRRPASPGVFKIRDPLDVPFYASPRQLFFVEWLMMLSTFVLHISFASYPDLSTALLLLCLASGGFLAGFFTLRWSYEARAYTPLGRSGFYRIDAARLRWFHIFCVLFVLGVMIMNLKRFGLPPIFGALLNADTLDYQEYGVLRGPMSTAVLSAFISAPLEKTAWRRWTLYLFCPACFLLYSSRGYLLIMLFQALAVFSLRTTKSKSKIYAVAGTTLALAVLASNLIGNSRNSLGVDALLGFLQIKQRYYDWPAAYLWVISYISTPFSNMCWIVKVFHYQHPSLNFLYAALPGEYATKSFEMVGDLGSEKIIDGVHTYMAKYFIDFWYFGILGINYIWGLIAAALQAGNRLTRNYLLSGVLLGCLGFIFFSDFLTILIIVLEMIVVVMLQAYIVQPVSPTTQTA